MHFQAVSIEVVDDTESGIVTITLDSNEDHYAQFQGVRKEFEQEYDDKGEVYFELDDQLYGAADCFEFVKLSPTQIVILGITDARISMIATDVRVSFKADEKVYEKLQDALALIFRASAKKFQTE